MAWSRSLLSAWLVYLCFITSFASEHHLVMLTDKHRVISQQPDLNQFFSIEAQVRRHLRRAPYDWHDYPVDTAYVNTLITAGFEIVGISRWLNAVCIRSGRSDVLQQLGTFPFVQSIIPLGGRMKAKESSEEHDQRKVVSLAEVFRKLEIDFLHEMGLDGAGLIVAVLDAGFSGARDMDFFKPFFNEPGALLWKDMTGSADDVFADGDHGTRVWSIMASRDEADYKGGAFRASYHLYKTEFATDEWPIEEFFFLMAMEHADSAGAWVMNASLGYHSFDDAIFNHKPEHLTGKHAFLSRAVALSASRGMIAVLSAGNEAKNKWKYVTIPADGDSILSVGASKMDGKPAPFSSFNFPDERLKPNIAAPGYATGVLSADRQVALAYGTSYAAPVIASAAVLLSQAFPEATVMEIINALLGAGSFYPMFDAQLGYGMPSVRKAFETLSKQYDMNALKVVFLPGEKFALLSGTMEGLTNITLIDENGTVVQEEWVYLKPYRKELFSTSDLDTGTYTLKVSGQQSVIELKVVVE